MLLIADIWLGIRSYVTAICAGCLSICKVIRLKRAERVVRVLVACSAKRSVSLRTRSSAVKVSH